MVVVVVRVVAGVVESTTPVVGRPKANARASALISSSVFCSAFSLVRTVVVIVVVVVFLLVESSELWNGRSVLQNVPGYPGFG